jgi:hypothetical protein
VSRGTIRGRPPKGEGERLVHVTIRVPPEVMEHFSKFKHPTVAIREALEKYVDEAAG